MARPRHERGMLHKAYTCDIFYGKRDTVRGHGVTRCRYRSAQGISSEYLEIVSDLRDERKRSDKSMKLNVSTPAELESAFSSPNVTEIQLVNDITLTKSLTLNRDIVIHGGGKTIDLGASKLGAGINALTLAETLTIKANSSQTGSTITGTGKFIVDEGANVIVTRSPGAHKTHLIDGFSEYLFKKNSSFSAQAETNRSESNKGTAQTGVICSFPAQRFIVEKNASVTLVSDYSGAKSTDHGSTALILRKPKGRELNIEVQENAVLNITAYGTELKTRDRAPVLILHEPVRGDTGVSRTLIKGKLNVTSNNGNGWYYQYIDYVTDTSDYFTVDGGEVNITARNGGSKDKTEYAAFESYGRNPTYITVENGGVMNVISNGYRGMSLAGGGSNAEKSIVVRGAGSKLHVYGYMWAIAAETQPTLSISAMDGGQIVLESCVDNLGNVSFAGSTVYSVGPTTYNVDGPNSRMDIIHRGGAYGAIFADGHGALKINVTRGGNMYVYSKNSGSDKAARRAAICAQTGLSNIHSIVVDGYGSVLRVINDDPEKTNDHSLYPRSAIAFAANTSGNITVRNGGAFFATNNDADSPTIALGGYGTNDTRGRFAVDSPYDIDIRNDASGKNPYAVALRSTNYLQNKQGDTKQSLEVKSANVTAWPIGNGVNHWPGSDSIDRWYVDFDPPLVAQNNVAVSPPFVGNKGSTTFKLSSYGRIAMEGTVTSVKINEGNVRVRIDQTEKLTVAVLPEWAKNKVVAWESKNHSVATIDANGVITPAPGALKPPVASAFTTITATSTDGSNRSDSCEVEVYTIPVREIELIRDFPLSGIEVGKEAHLRARIHPADAVDKALDWKSSNPNVLSVTPLGDGQAVEQTVLLKALQSSETPITITATARDGYGAEASCRVIAYVMPDVRYTYLEGQLKKVFYTNIDGMAYFEGDVVLGTTADMEAIKAEVESRLPAFSLANSISYAIGIALSKSRSLWPNRTIPFLIEPGFPEAWRIDEAIAHIQENTNLRLVPRTNEARFIMFRNHISENSAPVGMRQAQSEHTIRLQNPLLGDPPPDLTNEFVRRAFVGVAVHEICHTAGLWHEQSRADRDSYVKIHWEHIQAQKEHNFNQHITDGDDIGPYEYGSIMHYGRRAFSIDDELDTITPINPPTAVIGQRRALSPGDIAAINFLYPARKATLGEMSSNGPALATSGSSILLGWTGVPNNLRLNFLRSDNGMDFHSKATLDDTSPNAPALAFFNGHWFVAWQGTDDHLNVMKSADGINWANKVTLGETSKSSPALAVFNGHLYLGWRGVGNNFLNVLRSANGTDWSDKATLSDTTTSGPALVGFGGHLLLGWRGTDNHLNVMSSGNGTDFGGKVTLDEVSEHRPALHVRGVRVFLSWGGVGNKRLNLLTSENGSSWSEKRISFETSVGGPALSSIGGELVWAWTGTDTRLNSLPLQGI